MSCVACHVSDGTLQMACVMCHMSHIIWPHLYAAPSAMKVQGGWVRWLQQAWWLKENTKKIFLFSFFCWKPYFFFKFINQVLSKTILLRRHHMDIVTYRLNRPSAVQWDDTVKTSLLHRLQGKPFPMQLYR